MKHHVLLVDDDAQIRGGLARALRHEPFEIRNAGSAEEALALLASSEIDLVVSDQEMGGMRGTEFLAEVRRRHPEVIRIMLTGRGTIDVAMRAINQGEVYRFLLKPAGAPEIALAIRQGLREHDLIAESRRLLRTVAKQDAVMQELESEVEGITRVDRDASGAIILPDVPTDFDALLSEMQAAVRQADERMQRIRERSPAGATPRPGSPGS